jgi:hypothetical protein
MGPGGRLLCLDVSEEWTAIARAAWEKAGVADRIELRIGPALDTLRELPPVLFDLAFVDADKVNYSAYYEELLPRIRPGGLLLFDVAGPGREPRPRRTWTDGEGWVVCVDAAEDASTRELTRTIVVFRRVGAGDGWRRSDERHVLRLYDPDAVRADLRAAGFADVEALAAWGELDLRPGHTAFAARRPGE